MEQWKASLLGGLVFAQVLYALPLVLIQQAKERQLETLLRMLLWQLFEEFGDFGQLDLEAFVGATV